MVVLRFKDKSNRENITESLVAEGYCVQWQISYRAVGRSDVKNAETYELVIYNTDDNVPYATNVLQTLDGDWPRAKAVQARDK